jgi:hypothetical protein
MNLVATRITRTSRTTLAAVVATATLAAVGISATFGGDSGETRTPAPAADWFRPIHEYYDLNPAITPETDFAELHFGDIGS